MRALAAVVLLFAGRNLFQYVEAPRPVPVVKKKQQAAPTVVIAPPLIEQRTSTVAPVLQAPAFPYRCIGIFGPNTDPFAVFDTGGAIINIRMGQIIDGKFIVRAIGVESVTIGVDGFPEQRIAIGAAR